MTPRVATVLSARDWESGLVAVARETAEVRMVLRAYRPEEVEQEAHRLDVVVAGAETSWVTAARIAAWRRRGLRVVGMFPSGDRPARQRLVAAGADEILSDDTPPSAVVRAIRLLQPGAPPAATPRTGPLVVVTGPAGSPGCTEVALGLAWNWAARHRTLLLDLDLEAPSLAVRLGRPPRPDLVDAAEAVHETGVFPAGAATGWGRVAVLMGAARRSEAPPPAHLVEDVAAAARCLADVVVADTGSRRPGDSLVKGAERAVLVADASPIGLVRAAGLAAEWSGPVPTLVLNRVSADEAADACAAARRWLGLEPAALIPFREAMGAAARRALPPARALRRALRSVDVE